MGSDSRHSTPLHDVPGLGMQHNGRRSLKLLKSKDIAGLAGNGNLNLNRNSKTNLDLLQAQNMAMSPDEMLTLIEANVRTYDIVNSPNDDTNINKYYSLNVNTIPPYVLARLAYKGNADTDSSNNENVYIEATNDDDPFTATFRDSRSNKVKWGEFLHTIKIPTSSVPVKKSARRDDMGYEAGEIYDSSEGSADEEDPPNDGDPQPYCPSLTSDSEKQIALEIFKGYDLHSKWKGGSRLRELFESADSLRSTTSTDSESSLPDVAGDSNGNDIDLEKGYKSRLKRHRLLMHRHKRERDIKDRAKYWISENKKTWKPKLLDSIMTNSYFPLFFRLISISLSTVALGLSSRLVKMTEAFDISQQPSPLMAMIVQAVGIFYLLYITYDEFTSQPLGLRDPTAKIRLVLLDLLFIIFSSANLSLSFQSIYDSRWVCTVGNGPGELLYDSSMCNEVKALTAFLFLTLVAWCINFTISVFRIVHAVSYTRDKN